MKRNLFYLLLLSVWLPNLLFAQWHYNILWQREGATDSSHYGSQIFALGDQNQDGYADWAVRASALGRTNQFVEFFHGSELPSQEPYMVIRTDTTTQWDFPYFFPAGDLNNDGFIDWICVFRPVDDHHVFVNQIYFGGPDADTISEFSFRTSWNVFFSAIGDYNADGFDDLFAHDFYDNTYLVYYGGSVMDSISDLNMPDYYRSNGDLNGDGYTDLVSWTGNFYYGGVSPDTIPEYVWSNLEISGAGIVNDLNGDEKDELVLIPNTLTSINVHFGRSDSLSRTPDYILNYPWGWRCFSLGDVNQDNYNDFAVIAQNGGGFAAFMGHPWLNQNPAFTVSLRSGPLYLPKISWVAGLGDVNNDGVNDIGIGSTCDDADGRRGKALILSGDSSYHVAVDDLFIPHPSSFILSVYPNPFNAEATIQLDLPTYTNEVSLSLFNILGQEVFKTELTNISSQTTYHLDASAFASGIYFLNVQAGAFITRQKLIILK